MSTRATYQITCDNGQIITYYIHSDGYPKGAANYFKKMNDCSIENTCYAARFLIANQKAEITISHDVHGDTEFQYTLDSNGWLLVKDIPLTRRNSKILFFGGLRDFIENGIAGEGHE